MEVKLEENLPSPYWDKKKTKQILANLLTNAIKFTPEGGSILVSAQNIGGKIK